MGFNRDLRNALDDCYSFGKRYFPHLLTQPGGTFHRELISLVEAPENDRLSILAPRGHAKSTWLSIIYPIWKIVTNRDIKIIIVSDTGEQADMFFAAIKQELEANERMLEDLGSFTPPTKKGRGPRWMSNKITVDRPHRAKEPTLFLAGSGTRLVGRRADLIIVDDPLNDENTETERQRKKTLRWFMKTLTPILNPDTGRMVVIGTRKHPDDLHAELGRNPRYHQHIFRALENGRALWPERWPVERLMREKEEVGSLVFAQEYQNEPVSEETCLFRPEWIRACADYDAVIADGYSGALPVITGWDLAIVADRARAEERDSDYTVGVSIAYDERDGTRRIVDMFRERGLSPAQVLTAIRDRARRFNPSLITIENNLFQSLYEQRLIAETDLPVAGHTTGREKMDVFTGVPSLSVLFENGKYILPRGNEASAKLMDALARELVGLGVEAHDDTVMALWIAECGIRRMKQFGAGVEIIDDPGW